MLTGKEYCTLGRSEFHCVTHRRNGIYSDECLRDTATRRDRRIVRRGAGAQRRTRREEREGRLGPRGAATSAGGGERGKVNNRSAAWVAHTGRGNTVGPAPSTARSGNEAGTSGDFWRGSLKPTEALDGCRMTGHRPEWKAHRDAVEGAELRGEDQNRGAAQRRATGCRLGDPPAPPGMAEVPTATRKPTVKVRTPRPQEHGLRAHGTG